MMRGRVLLLATVAACSGSKAKPPSIDALPPELAPFGELARLSEHRGAARVAGTGGVLAVGDGATLTVAEGALPHAVGIAVRRVELDVHGFDPDVKAVWAYVIDTDRDIASFGGAVTLTVPRAPEAMTAATWRDGRWVAVPLARGPSAAVEVRHFSRGTFAFLEWWASRSVELGQAIDDEDSPAHRKRGHLRHRGNESAHAFYGIGETYAGSRDALCDEIRATLAAYPGASYVFPPDSDWRNVELGTFLHAGSAASTEGGYFAELVADSLPNIEATLLAQPGQVSPARMLAICIDENGGSVPLGVLACHNFLKDIAYNGRDHTADMPERYGAVAARLTTWRSSDTNPAGDYDKMGPLYHIFAAMTAGVWFAHTSGGHAAAAGEALLRTFQHGADTPDPEKGHADACGAEVADFIRSQDGKMGAPRDAGAARDSRVEDDAATPVGGIDAGPAPADEPERWDGRWKGRSRVSGVIDGKGDVWDEPIELSVRRTGDTVLIDTWEDGKSTYTDKFTVSRANPNVASAEHDGAQAGGGRLAWRSTVFLRDGKLYLVKHVETETPVPSGGMVVSTLDDVAELERVEP